MKVIAINGSPRANGNTFNALSTVIQELEAQGIETEIIHIGNKIIRGCIACGHCAKTANGQCVFKDEVNEIIQKMIQADGILLGSPVYYAGINGTMKSFLDRVFFSTAVSGRPFRLKIGAAVVALRRGGATATFDQLNKYFSISEMIVPNSNYWNQIHGMLPDESNGDEEGLQTMRVLGKNMSWLLKLIEYGKTQVPPPQPENKILTNFIH